MDALLYKNRKKLKVKKAYFSGFSAENERKKIHIWKENEKFAL